MSSLYRLNIQPLYARAKKMPMPHAQIAWGLARWLKRVSDSLDMKDLPFESGSAVGLAEEFEMFAEDDGSPEGFIKLWLDLENWAETAVVSNGHEKALCEMPPLPETLEC